jgi:hypothetical protein
MTLGTALMNACKNKLVKVAIALIETGESNIDAIHQGKPQWILQRINIYINRLLDTSQLIHVCLFYHY